MSRTKKPENQKQRIRAVEIAVPFVSSPVDMLARVTAELHHAVEVQQNAWGTHRENIAVYGPKTKELNGALFLVYRIVQDSDCTFFERRNAWSYRAETLSVRR